MDLAAEQYSFGDHAYRRFTETIKDAGLNGILSPGKQGSGRRGCGRRGSAGAGGDTGIEGGTGLARAANARGKRRVPAYVVRRRVRAPRPRRVAI